MSRSTDDRAETPVEPVEVEVKLAISRPRLIATLVRNPDPDLLAGFQPAGEVHVVRTIDRYLDTDEVPGRLAAGLLRARLRSVGRVVTLTVKRPGVEQDGVTTRVELEGPATRQLDPGRWPVSDARAALVAVAGDRRLREVAALRQRRLTRIVRRGGTRVELSLDRLDAVDRGRVLARRHELEAELLAGDRGALVELAQALGRLDGVGPPLGSKLAFALEARTANLAAR